MVQFPVDPPPFFIVFHIVNLGILYSEHFRPLFSSFQHPLIRPIISILESVRIYISFILSYIISHLNYSLSPIVYLSYYRGKYLGDIDLATPQLPISLFALSASQPVAQHVTARRGSRDCYFINHILVDLVSHSFYNKLEVTSNRFSLCTLVSYSLQIGPLSRVRFLLRLDPQSRIRFFFRKDRSVPTRFLSQQDCLSRVFSSSLLSDDP